MAYEIDCDICGSYAEGNNCKQVCIHCYNNAWKQIRKLEKRIERLEVRISKQERGKS